MAFTCQHPGCGRKFTTAEFLTRHEAVMHKDEPAKEHCECYAA